MAVEIRLPTLLRVHAQGNSSVSLEGSSLREVFDRLIEQFPAMAGQVITAEGSFHKFVNVYVNDDDVRYLDKLDTKLNDGDVITILPAVAGG